MTTNKTVRLGIIGMGNMGTSHAKNIIDGKIPNLELAAIADQNPERLEKFKDITHFSEGMDLIQSGTVDAVLVATPHYSHTTLGIASLEAGLHTLVEKPISVHKEDCERLIAAWKDEKLVFSAMFNQRTDPAYRKVKSLIESGELGSVERINWIITDWYRTENYYTSGGWRATWGGEGGGVLLNQCPHNLDLLQWIFGMPSKVTANCQFGRFHNIEVEDAVTAMLEYPNGATGVFITTTGEAPGTNRLEIACERGKIVVENGKLHFTRTEQLVSEHSKTATNGFQKPGVWNVEIPLPEGNGEQHNGILKNFTNAILEGEALIAPAGEGIHSVELANAMLFSAFEKSPVELPLDGAAYARVLKAKIENSTYVKPEIKGGKVEELSW
ncbi:Gfo/Idh/MocA family oxidoreductase [Coraliomargarita sp. SDUM461003]|uniref:Gfo/Idh/MocA family oxidoreductase n=1 Tax=Thalassobacterium maritimum TaxID=3041265 RepID=A0ABU1AY64_9BACT|nr:Gfo/Idh/MocA family oxidoreductase [Coraliomargarita sp. SDUM461003]MDQ8208179.1 Gfo/Idh/MocA family oxidoreductase [Coraliomargarita sp. SDUM461003]